MCAHGTARSTVEDKLVDRLGAYVTPTAPATVDQKAEYALAVLKLWDPRNNSTEQINATTFAGRIDNMKIQRWSEQ